jgi:hypothetical protein
MLERLNKELTRCTHRSRKGRGGPHPCRPARRRDRDREAPRDTVAPRSIASSAVVQLYEAVCEVAAIPAALDRVRDAAPSMRIGDRWPPGIRSRAAFVGDVAERNQPMTSLQLPR